MPADRALMGREQELAELESLAASAQEGSGALVFVLGEAGLGKTRLVEEAIRASAVTTYAGAARKDALTPYGAVVAALRSFHRARPEGFEAVGPVSRFLAVLMPELGKPPADVDDETLREAILTTLLAIPRQEPVIIFLDDLHWADEATLSLLPMLVEHIQELGVLVIGAYRTDELSRGHPLRRMRRELRRVGRLRELGLEPLDAESTAAVAAGAFQAPPARSLAALVHERTQGIPFFIEELCAALSVSNRLVTRSGRVELERGGELPIPESVREAVLVRMAALSDSARSALDVAAVSGHDVDLELVAELGGEQGIDELLTAGALHETEPGRAAFRHALTRDALYADVPWTRRRALHRLLAERLELRRAPPLLVGEHWLAAREFHRACPALAAATAEFSAVYAYRDALAVARRAAEAWPDGLDEPGRLQLMQEIGSCAEVAGELAEAISAWREVADRRRLAGDTAATATAERRLAGAYELQGSYKLAQTARREAARDFSRSGKHADAAGELLAAAAHLDSAGSLGAALELVEQALAEARSAGRRDLEARALGVEGTVRAKLGQTGAGLEAARAGLALALEEDVAPAAVDVYQHVANVLENAGDYEAAWDTYQAAYDYCEARGAEGSAQVCLVCLAAILLFTGQWDRALELDRAILASPHAPMGVRMGAKQHFGLINAARGDARAARRHLNESGAYAERFERQRMEVWDVLGQSWVDELEGDIETAIDRCRSILARWGTSESRHYPVPALRWATTFLATHGAEAEARASAAALTRLARETVNPEALAGLAHALGEVALLDGDPEQAVMRFEHAIDVLGHLELPYETAQTKRRSGIALVQAGRRKDGVERLVEAYRAARKLGARPLAAGVTRELSDLGEQVDRRLGRRAAAMLEGPGLTQRELGIMRLVAAGRTNREIASELFISPRTVDMHVRNILRKLDARSRADATNKAAALGLLR